MILGVLSDSHGQQVRTRRAVEVLKAAGAQALVHCGDFVSPDVMDELAGNRTWCVLGNCDEPGAGLLRNAAHLGLTCAAQGPLKFEAAGRSVWVFHGHEPAFGQLVRQLEGGSGNGLSVDFVCYGHTHAFDWAQIGSTRLLNPGALHRAPLYTVATLDLVERTASFWRVREDSSALESIRSPEIGD